MYQLFFDLDHTLWDFDTNSTACLKEIYLKFDLQNLLRISESKYIETYNFHNDRMWSRFRRGFISREELRWKRVWHTLLEHNVMDLPLTQAMSNYYLEILPKQTVLCDGALDLLNYLSQKGYPLHLITNGFEDTQIEKLKYSGIDHFFQQIITSEKAKFSKPAKEIFDFSLALTHCEAENAVMIGDNMEVDVMGALQAEWPMAIHYNPSHIPIDYPTNTQGIFHLLDLKTIF